MSRVIIAPSILASNLANLSSDTRRILALGGDWVHVDIMVVLIQDGHFVPNLSFGPPVVKCLKADLPDAFLDCHCMVTNPTAYLTPLQKAGASQLTFHIETMSSTSQTDNDQDFRAFLQAIRVAGLRAGVALKPSTSVSPSLRSALQDGLIDLVLIMTVGISQPEPGFGGQSFMSEPLEKARGLRLEFPSLDIEVDGGITVNTVQTCAEAGANVFVSGTGVFGEADPHQAMVTMRRLGARTTFGAIS